MSAPALGIGYYVSSPYITFWRIKVAANDGDTTVLTDHIDFPSLRQSVKDQLNLHLAKDLKESSKGSRFVAGLGMMLGPAMIDRFVDTYVTPAGMAELLREDESLNSASSNRKGKENTEKPPKCNVTRQYRSLDRFDVSCADKDNKVVSLVFRRQGLFTWRVTDIDLVGY